MPKISHDWPLQRSKESIILEAREQELKSRLCLIDGKYRSSMPSGKGTKKRKDDTI